MRKAKVCCGGRPQQLLVVINIFPFQHRKGITSDALMGISKETCPNQEKEPLP